MIATTDYHGTVATQTVEQSEKKTITAISGNQITLNTPLKFMHFGIAPMAAEVGLLTRNVVIQGEESSDNSTFGGLFIQRAVSASHIDSVEFIRMGQEGLVARYPWHAHLYTIWVFWQMREN